MLYRTLSERVFNDCRSIFFFFLKNKKEERGSEGAARTRRVFSWWDGASKSRFVAVGLAQLAAWMILTGTRGPSVSSWRTIYI